MPDGSKAVFLSYASQDAEAAKGIAEALRAAGVEVWFDQNELVGGDAWDNKIRGQIASCALFVPVISAATQARLEGYFRIEWKLAAQRTHAMAEEKAFLLPVVIDDTRDAEAKVPGEFKAVQWTRLAGGEPTPGFVARVKRLLEPSAEAVSGVGRVSDPPSEHPAHEKTKAGHRPALPQASRLPVALGVIALIGVAGYYGWQGTRPATPPLAPVQPSSVSSLPATRSLPPVTSPEKSVAVLAFANLGNDKEQEYFSDGISEELLNVLAKIPGLKVSARTSAFYFKGKQVPIPEIAKQLGVAYVVEGSVRKQGDKVRITAQLIKAADGFQVWSDTFTRDLKDIFAVQDEIAGLIAQQLQLKLGESSRAVTQVNPEAYRLVLEGRYFWLQRTEESFVRAEAAYKKALEHDPQFAQARAGLADVWSIRAWYKLIGGNRQVEDDLSRAHAEVRLAIQIDPSLAETHATLGAVLFNQRTFSEANQAFQTSLRLNPNYGFARHWYAQLLFAEGRPKEGLLEMDRAISADPLAFISLASYAVFLGNYGLYEEALAMNDRAIALRSDMFVPAIGQRAYLLLSLGRKEEALALARSVVRQASVQPRWWMDGTVIHVLRATGQQREAEAHAAQILQTLPPDNMVRGFVLAGVGRPAEAVQQLLATGLESSMIFSFLYDSFWDEVRQDPRLPEVLAKLNLVEEYRRGRDALAQIRQERGRKQ